MRAIDTWFLFPNLHFKDRKLFVGKCSKCKQSVILLSETRKTDGKIFTQLEVGKRADKVAEIHLEQIDYTKEDSKLQKSVPFGFVYGKAKKDLKNKRFNIYRIDFNKQDELIGYIPFEETKIKDLKEN